ncbi:MAG: hypothetical protein V3U13_08370 [Gemmatimonadota bacterium]
MSSTLSLFTPEPGVAGSPAASRAAVFTRGLENLLRTAEPALDLRLQWLQPPGAQAPGQLGDWVVAARWSAGELRRILRDPSRYLLFVYPCLPVFAYVQEPSMLTRVRHGFQALSAKCRLTHQRIVVVVMDLPADMAEGEAIADGRAAELDTKRVRDIEQTLFRAAWRLITPDGLSELISDRYSIEPARIRSFRRDPYPPSAASDTPPAIDLETGNVNFFYSGPVDSQVAPNFREVLRSVRNAPATRLHVCGPGRDAVREWLTELDVPNVRHHGKLGIAEHDWLAQHCDVGLILYPFENPYYHLRPTLKYSAYLANGLAVLSTDLRCVAENIRRDRVGQSMPVRELALEVLRWATRPKLWTGAKARAAALSEEIRSGSPEMRAWIEEIAQDR